MDKNCTNMHYYECPIHNPSYGVTPETKENLLVEKLAELEHEQWMEWSKHIAGRESISEGRYQRWCKQWIPYKDLTEEEKEQDRKYARKVLEIINKQ